MGHRSARTRGRRRAFESHVRVLTAEQSRELQGELDRVADRGRLDTSIGTGQILSNVAGGGFTDFRGFVNDKEQFLDLARSLYERGGPVTPDELYLRARIYVTCTSLDGLQRYPSLGALHYEAVLDLPEADQKRLLARAELDRWTADELADEVARSGPRPKLTPLTEGVHDVRRAELVIHGDDAYVIAHTPTGTHRLPLPPDILEEVVGRWTRPPQ